MGDAPLTQAPHCNNLKHIGLINDRRFRICSSPVGTNSDSAEGTEMDNRHYNAALKIARLALIALLLAMNSNIAMAFEQVNTTFFGVAIKGYDTVAYHTEGRAVKGSSEFSHKWNDAKWYFTNPENRDLFAADPERYAPQYGGY
jgi:YHS domain-containing protein